MGPAADNNLLFDIDKSNVSLSYYAVGSCRMLTSRKTGVVNDDLKVFGISNLWVADCIIEPIVQTGYTVYMGF